MAIGYYGLIRNIEVDVAMIQSTSTIEAFYDSRHICSVIGCMCIHQTWIGIEVIVRSTTHQCFYAGRNLIGGLGYIVGIEAGIIGCIGNITETAWLVGKHIAIRLNHTTILTREGSF